MHGLNNTAKAFEMYGSLPCLPVHYGGARRLYMRTFLKVKTTAAPQPQIDKMVAQVEQSFVDGHIGLSSSPSTHRG
jgi:hypothetical protein